MSGHFAYIREQSFGTWVTPTKWLPVDSMGVASSRAKIELPVSGADRGIYLHVLGEKPVGGPLGHPWFPVNVASLIRTFMTNLTTTNVSTGVYDHAFLYDDTANLGSFCGQKRYTPSLAQSFVGAMVNTFTLSVETKAAAHLAYALLCKDEVRNSGTWDYNGSAGPAVLAPSYPTVRRPLMFYDGAIAIGGTPTLDGTTKKLSLAGATTYTKISKVEIVMNHNLDADGYGIVQDPTVQELIPGGRRGEVSFEISWSDYAATFYDAARAGTAMALSLDLVGPTLTGAYKYEGHALATSLFFDPVTLPEINSDSARKKLTLKGAMQTDLGAGVDFGLWIRTSEATL